MQLSMLKSRNEDSFGLDYVTVYNWGTYDTNPDTIRPELQHSWITGENRAGKSTVLDAVVTLLTPNRKRLYNAASGSEKSSERNEKSYIKGAYNQGEEGSVKYLRPDEGEYSVLIGCFRTKISNRVVCLAQVLWLHDEKASKFFVVSEKPLTMDEFKGASNISLLKKQLKSIDPNSVKVYDQFNDYSHAFMKLFGMRSGKALELFGVAVSLRDLENLGGFIRNSMLDRLDVSAQVNTVIELHRNSAETYKNILKANDQIEILKVLPDSWETYKKCTQEIVDRDIQLSILKPYLSFQYIDVCGVKKERHKEKKQEHELRQNTLSQKKDQVQGDVESLKVALSQDKGASQIEKLEIEIKALTAKEEGQRKTAKLYNEDAMTLDLPGCEDEKSYNDTIEGAIHFKSQLPAEIKLAEDALSEANLNCSKKSEELRSLRSEFDSLGKRDSNIPEEHTLLRGRVAEAVGLTSDDLPFLGELIQVKKDEHDWEGALERLLYGNALYVLVDEKHYSKVTIYVKKNNLRGRLSFMRVDPKSAIKSRPERDDNLFAFSKIAVKECGLSSWIERHLRKVADHLCCESTEDLMASNRGIVREGLIRNDSERHIKNDRSDVNDRTKFILGWDTKLKREALIARIQVVASELSSLQTLAREYKIKLEDLNKKTAAAKNIARYKSFDEVSYNLTASQIAAKKNS
ncbi:MAG TPA: ATP-binding protein, partial [Pseudobdellovibrionaceae bacterium]|nr:ATP-binding protein [Pseudobdellovibrionaceae bacterium]